MILYYLKFFFNFCSNKSLFVLTDEQELNTIRKENEELKKKITSLELALKQSQDDDDGEEVDDADKKVPRCNFLQVLLN